MTIKGLSIMCLMACLTVSGQERLSQLCNLYRGGDAQKTECVADVQQNERNKGDEPVNLISDEVVGVDSVYKLCIQKMACLIKNPSEKQFFELENEFVYADDYSESLLYNIVAANKRKR